MITDTQNPILEIGIDWSVFELSERELLEKAISRGDIEHLAAILNEVSPAKAEEIEKIQNRLRPKSFTFESSVQKEAEKWIDQNFAFITPEKEAEWQAKIDAEKAEKMKAMGIDVNDIKLVDGSNDKKVVFESNNDLSKVKGLKKADIEKLVAAGVDTAEKYLNLPIQDKKDILANNLKTN